jgi:fatty-acyl-CoA synthase
MVNLSAFIAYHARRAPDRVALIHDGREITYAAFLRRIERLAALLVAKGIEPGHRVAVFMKNSPAFLEIAFAASHVGAVFLPVNFRLVAEEADYILDHAGARLVFVDAEFADSVAGREAVIVDADAQADASVLVPADLAAPPACPRAPDDLLRLMYTSGTTSRPKGVMISYDNFYWKCASQVIVLELSRATRLLAVGPLYHAATLDLPGIGVLWVGGTICILRDFSPQAVLGAIQDHRLTGGWLAPVMTGAVLSYPNRDDYDVSSLQWITAGGERTPEPRVRAFAKQFPNARYVDAYGLTESCSGDTFMEAGREIEKIGSCGPAVPHVEIEIRDDAGNGLPAGQDGEICLRGPKITKGYWRDPDATAAAIDADGWFRTGDVGHLDADGFLYLTDRKKDMILSGGENIASSEVERVLFEMPAVADAAVIGLPDERWGEKPVAVVVLAPGAALDHATLEAHCRAHLAGFKVPKALYIRDDLPRNPSGKVLKRLLRDEYA